MATKIIHKVITIPKKNQKTGINPSFVDSLIANGSAIIRGVGRFQIKEVKSRKFFHNMSGKVITTKARHKVRFTPYGKIKKICRQ